MELVIYASNNCLISNYFNYFFREIAIWLIVVVRTYIEAAYGWCVTGGTKIMIGRSEVIIQ